MRGLECGLVRRCRSLLQRGQHRGAFKALAEATRTRDREGISSYLRLLDELAPGYKGSEVRGARREISRRAFTPSFKGNLSFHRFFKEI